LLEVGTLWHAEAPESFVAARQGSVQVPTSGSLPPLPLEQPLAPGAILTVDKDTGGTIGHEQNISRMPRLSPS